MKKLLSLALILALVATLTTSVFAADNIKNVVGTHGKTPPSVDDGITGAAFSGLVNSGVQVDIKVTSGAYESRYAVDIEYNDIAFNVVGNNMVWDVNQLKYVVVGGGTLSQPADQTITVKNYSDQPVTLNAAVAEETVLANSPMTVEATCSKNTIAKAKAAIDGVDGEAAKETVTISVKLKSGTWDDVATYFANELNGNTTLKVATVTITIGK